MMRSPEQQFAMAKGLPIPELAKVLQGQSDIVDMSIAEMVLRQKMQAQKAQQGMAAQPIAQQPKVVEQDLMQAQQMMQPQAQQMSQPMMDQGVAALPADVDVPEFAGGGIVSFQGGGQASLPFASSVGSPLQSTRVPGPGVTFSQAFPNAAAIRSTASRMPGLFGRAAAALSPLLMLDQFTGPTDLEIAKLREFDKAKDVLRNAGFTDRDIDALKTPDVYRMAMGYGYQPSAAVGAPATGSSAAPVDATAAAPAQAAPAVQAPVPDQKAAPTADDLGLAGIQKQIQALQSGLTRPTMAASAKEVEDMYKAAGVSMDPYAEYKRDLEEQKAQNAADRKRAGWFRGLEAGLGILGGESPYALTNIGKGSQAAAKGAAEDAKEFSKLERERSKALASISVAENDLKRGVTDKKIARYDQAIKDYGDKEFEIKKLGISVDLKKMEVAASKGDRRMKEALDAAQTDWKNLSESQKLSGGPGGKPLDEKEFLRNRATEYLGFFQKGTFGNAAGPATLPAGIKVTREK
jgi:hypothetical protein